MLDAIKVQNEMNEEMDGINMRIVKRGVMVKKYEQEGRKDGTLIIETDSETHKKLIKNGKLNLGWRRCRVYDFVSVLRCFKCWGYNHMAKHCKKEEVCHHCAGNHNSKNCKSTSKRCTNCMERNKMYGINNIKDDHGAMRMPDIY